VKFCLIIGIEYLEFINTFLYFSICTGLAWDRDGDLLGIICDGSSNFMLWEANTSKTQQINPVFKDNLTCILWSKVSQTVAVTSAKGNLTIYDYASTK
jgi:WD repeat-containing protein 19